MRKYSVEKKRIKQKITIVHGYENKKESIPQKFREISGYNVQKLYK